MPAPTGQDLGEDIRNDLNAAFAAAEKGETPPETGGIPPEAPPIGETPPETPPEGETPPETPPEGETPPETPPEGQPPAETAPVVTESVGKDDRAPGTWSPAAREAWKDLPKDVKAEIWKRERDTSRALTNSMKARQFEQEFTQTMAPYMGFIAAENSTPMQAVNYMMRTGAILRVGTAQQKAETVASVIKQFGVSLEMLDSLLAGEQPQDNPQANLRQLVQAELAPVMQMLSQHRQGQQRTAAAEDAEIMAELDAFANDPKHEFYWDVKEDMEILLEVASRRGRTMTLTQAYERAIMESEPVRRVIAARKARSAALEANRTANAARRSASSITPSANAGTITPAKSGSLRDDIVAAIDAQQGR